MGLTTNYVDMTNPLLNLGRYQKLLLKELAQGYWIKHFRDLNDPKQDQFIIIHEENEIRSGIGSYFRVELKALLKRGLLNEMVIYKTVQPETETIRYDLKEEFKEKVKKL